MFPEHFYEYTKNIHFLSIHFWGWRGLHRRKNCHFYATFPLTGTADTAKKRGERTSLSSFKKPVLARFCLLAEVAVQQTLEGLAVAGFVAGHFMDGVVDGVQIILLR